MQKVNVQKPWQGKIAIRDIVVKRSTDKKEGMLVTCDKKEFELPYEVLMKPVMKHRVPDKFSQAVHTLYYYKMPRPADNQGKLL